MSMGEKDYIKKELCSICIYNFKANNYLFNFVMSAFHQILTLVLHLPPVIKRKFKYNHKIKSGLTVLIKS